jgi:hypothetical protein
LDLQQMLQEYQISRTLLPLQRLTCVTSDSMDTATQRRLPAHNLTQLQ